MNPFATRCIRPDNNVYRFACDPSHDEMQRHRFLYRLLFTLRTQRRAAIVGPHGSGKTTLLRSLEPELISAFGHLLKMQLSSEKRQCLRQWLPAIEAIDPREPACLVVDGYEQLSWWDQYKLVRRLSRRKQVALLVTCHRPPWLIPTCLTTCWDDQLSRHLTQEKLNNVPIATRVELSSFFETRLHQCDRAKRNLRELWFEMYDAFEVVKRREGKHQ